MEEPEGTVCEQYLDAAALKRVLCEIEGSVPVVVERVDRFGVEEYMPVLGAGLMKEEGKASPNAVVLYSIEGRDDG